MEVSFVRWGGCRVADNRYNCALEPDDCLNSDGDPFVTPNKLYFLNHFSCNSVDNIPIGRCGNYCSLSPQNCNDPNSWVPNNSNDASRSCTIREDLSRQGQYTRYSACVPPEDVSGDSGSSSSDSGSASLDYEKFCVVSGLECGKFGQVALHHNPYCDCSKTRTGACFLEDDNGDISSSGGYYCAISAGACTGDMTFLTAHELNTEGKIDCRLCDTHFTDIVESYSSSSSSSSDDTISTVPVGVFLGVVFGFCVVVGVMGILCWKRRGSKEGSHSLPTVDVSESTKAETEGELS